MQRWRDDLGLSAVRIIETATESRAVHPNSPDGPKALDRFMERAAQRDAQKAAAAASSGKAKPRRKTEVKPPNNDDEVAVYYAAIVNSDEYLPRDLFGSRTCGLMLARGLVTPERLRQRGVR